LIIGQFALWFPDDPRWPIEERFGKMIRDEKSKHTGAIDQLRDSHEKHKEEVAEKTKEMEEKIHLDLE